ELRPIKRSSPCRAHFPQTCFVRRWKKFDLRASGGLARDAAAIPQSRKDHYWRCRALGECGGSGIIFAGRALISKKISIQDENSFSFLWKISFRSLTQVEALSIFQAQFPSSCCF